MVQTAMDLYHILSDSNTHLRNPVALETQLLADEGMDDEVGKSMLQLLQVRLSLVSPFLSLPSLAVPFLALHRPSLHCLSLSLPFHALPFLSLSCLALLCLASLYHAIHLLSQLCIAFDLLSGHHSCLAPVNLPRRTAVSAITRVRLHAAYAGQHVP